MTMPEKQDPGQKQVSHLSVVLDDGLSDEQAERLREAILQLRGVRAVAPFEVTAAEVAEFRTYADVRTSELQVICRIAHMAHADTSAWRAVKEFVQEQFNDE